jgi:DNA (cytosine-5)-methyltransferase 3A
MNANKLKVLSLFDGIAGAKQALKELGIKIDSYYSSEIDKYAIQVAKNNHPDIIHIGDVKGVVIENDYIFYNQNNDLMKNGGSFKSNVDLLIGGSPCTDLSIAKKDRQGLSGERSSLFFEYVRILKEIKPKYFILENVASMSSNAKNEITNNLFGIEPTLINSSLLTAQQRKRYYWVGALQEDGSYKKIEIKQPQDKGVVLKDIIESGNCWQEKSYSLTASYDGAVFWNTLEKKQRTIIAEPIRIGQINKGGQGDRVYSVEGKSVCLSANGGGMGAKTGLYKIDLYGNYIIRKLTPNECARLQGFPDNYHEGISNTQAYKCYGNSFTVSVIKHILQHFVCC